MPYSEKDQLIFVTGVVGRAMGSGAFTNSEFVKELTVAAKLAFVECFGEPVKEPERTVPNPLPEMAGRLASDMTAAFNANVGAGAEPAAAEGKPFSLWRYDTIGFGKFPVKALNKAQKDCTWAEALSLCAQKDPDMMNFLRRMAGEVIDETQGWAKSAHRRQERARAVLGAT